MSQEVDWLHSQAGVCKVDLYNPDGGKDQDRKVICFVDVASLNIKNTDDTGKDATGQSKGSESATGLDLGKMQDKEVIVIKDSETPEQSKTEGAVCLFKQGSTEELNVVTWLFDDLQKYACGFQHALSPSPSPRQQKPSADKVSQQNNNNTAFQSSECQKGSADEVASTVQKLCSLVMQMASKEISENLEDAASKCIRQAIYATKDGKAITNPGCVSKIASKMVNEAMENAQEPSCKTSQDNISCKKDEGKGGPKKTSLFYGEVCSNQSESMAEDEGKAAPCAHLIHPRRQSGRSDGNSFNKGLMVYANKNAKDMTFSFVNATKIHKRQPLPACVVLKRVFLKHTKDVISDLIDSTMKNLHNVTGVLMTDSDFVTTVKKNLFNAGTQKSTEILEAMVLRMYNALMSETKEKGHSLVYSLLKTGCSLDPNGPNMHFASLKGGLHTREKVKQDTAHTSAQKVGESIIKDGISMLRSKTGGKCSDRVHIERGTHEKKPEKSNSTTEFLAKDLILTALMLIQQHLLTQYKEPTSESNTSSFGYFEKGGKHGSKSHSYKGDPQQQEYQRGEIQSALLSIIQKVLQEAGFNVDECEVTRNFKQSSSDDRPNRKCSPKQYTSDVDSENMDQINKKFIDQLMESVMKLCMYMTKSPDFVVEDYSDEQGTCFTARNKGVSTPDSMTCQKPSRPSNIGKPLVPAGSEVIVNNQTSNTSSQNRELQAVLQWMAASHFQVPNLTFMNENDEELKKLPQVADKAAKKGASVGDILQEVMKYFEKQQVDAAVGNMPRCGLLDWLLANL